MPGNPKITVGQPIPLSMTTVDNVAGLDVRASVVDCFGIGHGTVKLQEVNAGIYTDLSIKMPDVPFVVVQYFIQDNDLYGIPSERFDSAPKPSLPEKYVDGVVTNKRKLTNIVEGDVVT